MELAVNTRVVIILGVIIVGGGITLVYKIYDASKDLPSEVSKQTEQQLFNVLLNSNRRIAVLDNQKTIERKESDVFAVAFRNELDATTTTFTVDVDGAPSVKPDGACTVPDECPSASTVEMSYALKRYESKAFLILVDVPAGAESGQYVFTVNVYEGDISQNKLYDRVKLYANVP